MGRTLRKRQQTARQRVCGREKRTRVHGREVFEWTTEEHEDDTHAEDLHAASGHVKHESLHGERLRRGDGKVPCAFRLQALIRLFRGLRGLRLCLGLLAVDRSGCSCKVV